MKSSSRLSGGGGGGGSDRMHRQRKKDLNLKPNRVLDKRSSRGMIYENEELRMRTIHINDEVDRSQSDIKKLKKENDNLKREIWSLRDEYEKLEDFLKKVYSHCEGEFGPLKFPWDDDYEEDEDCKSEFMSEGGVCNEDNGGDNASLFCREGSHESDVTVISVPVQGPEGVIPMQEHGGQSILSSFVENQTIDPEVTATTNITQQQSATEPPNLITGVLPVVQEESETSTNTSNTGSMSPIADVESNNHINTHPTVIRVDSDTPVIEITPAMSPPPVDSTPQSQSTTPPQTIQSGNQNVGQNWQHFQQQLNDLCETMENNNISTDDPNAVKTIQKSANSSITASLRKRGDKRLSDVVSGKFLPSLFGRANNNITNCCCCCRHSLCNSGVRTTCQSEPSSLHSMGLRDTNCFGNNTMQHQKAQPMIFGDSLQQLISPWNAVDSNILVGVFDSVNQPIRAQDLIDAFEKDSDSILSTLTGVRILNQSGRLFVCLKSSTDVDSFMKNLPSRELHVNSNTIVFTPGAKNSIEVTLSGLPADLGDANVISVLNQYGQVVRPIERSLYKGVDTCERTVHMHLIKLVPPLISISGYDVSAKINCQDLSQVTNNNIDVDSCSRVSSPVGANITPSLSPTCQLPSSNTHVPVTNYNQSVEANNSTTTGQVSKLTVNAQINHKTVGRSTSSAPRLETDPSAGIPVQTSHRRQLSVGHPNTNQNNAKKLTNSASIGLTNSNNSSTTSLNVVSNVPAKKPLSRLTRAYPGNENGEAGGFKQSFYRGFPGSFMRRNSSSASQHSNIGFSKFLPNEPSGLDKERISRNNSSSEMKAGSSASKVCKQYGSEKDGNLPWCGCWGNGLI